jgi:hypothetical protein
MLGASGIHLRNARGFHGRFPTVRKPVLKSQLVPCLYGEVRNLPAGQGLIFAG